MLKKFAYAATAIVSMVAAGFCMYMLAQAQQGINAQGWGLAFVMLGTVTFLCLQQLGLGRSHKKQ